MARAVTVTQDVHDRLRTGVLPCRLAPGERLRTEVLCQRSSAGSSVVREALSRLATGGVVTLQPQRGCYVTPLSMTELQALTATRCKIGALCIEDAIAHADLEWDSGIITALHRLSKTPVRAKDGPACFDDAFAVANGLFPRAVVAACRSPALLAIREAPHVRQERCLWLTLPLAKTDRDVRSEHQAIASAAMARDATGAVATMTQHLNRSAETVLSSCRVEGNLLMPDPARAKAA